MISQDKSWHFRVSGANCFIFCRGDSHSTNKPIGFGRNSAHLIYIDVKACEESNGVEQDGADFKIC